MSIDNNPKPVTNGLVMNMDSDNLRSYVGPPIRNIATQITQQYGDQSNSTFKVTNGSEVVSIPSIGRVTSKYVDMYNDYNGGSGQCCPAPYAFGSDMATNASTLHTYAILYKSMNGYTHPNYMYRYEYNGATYVLESGVFDTAKRIHLGDDWYWAWNTFTTNAATTRFNYIAFFMYEYAKYNRMSVANVLLTQGDYSTLHPRYWPALGTTRSNTQAILDLTKQKTITASSLTYASNGTFSFNGSTDYLTMTNTTLGNGDIPWTVSAWVKTTTNASTLGAGSVLSNSSGGPVYSMMGVNSGKIVYWTYQNGAWAQKLGTGTTVNDGNWHLLTWVNYSNYTMDMYVDGKLDSSVANSTSGNQNPVDRIGGSWSSLFSGSISALSIYDNALSAQQVLQNFNALRGRYGV